LDFLCELYYDARTHEQQQLFHLLIISKIMQKWARKAVHM